MPEHDQNFIKESLQFIDEYERKGLFMGVGTGFATFFFPAIRRLPIYFRLPVAGLGCFYFCNWGYNYGRDLVWVRCRNIIENWERDMGLRNFQMSL
jgi:hypothetical protein